MRKLLAFLLIASVGLAQSVTLEQAQNVVTAYLYQGETLDMNPQALAYSESAPYWVFEIKSLGRLVVMIPVNADSGSIDTSNDVVSALNVHYLANFLEADESIDDFLGSTLSFAQQKQTAYEGADSALSTYEPQIPENITLTGLSTLKASLGLGVTSAEALRDEVLSVQSLMDNVVNPSDILTLQDAFDTLFAIELDFLAQAKVIRDDANAFVQEIAASQLTAQNPNLAQAFVAVVDTYGLAESVITVEDTMFQNQDTIDDFFDTLDAKGNEFLLKLQSRTSQSEEELARQANLEKINGYNEQYNEIVQKANDAGMSEEYVISTGFESSLTELHTLINQSFTYCTAADPLECMPAEDNFVSIEYQIESLNNIIDNYQGTTTCTGGHVLVGNQCVCPDGTTEVNGTCVSQSGGINWLLVFGILLIITGLILYGLKKRGGGEVEEPETTQYWGANRF